MSFQQLRDFFDKLSGGANFIDRQDLVGLLKRAGVQQTKGEFLETIEKLDINDDGVIHRKEFVEFFRKKIASGGNSKFNRLMVKSVIGRPKHSSYDLPGEYHTYGAKVPRDKEGSKEVILTWKPFKAEQSEEKNLNIVKMNKRAIANNCLTASTMTAFNRDHPIYDKKVMKARTTTVSTQAMLGAKAQDKAFGITKRASTPIRDLVCGKYNTHYDESYGEPFYPQHNASVNRIKKQRNKKTYDGQRPTKASLGHGQRARQMKEKPKAQFKMKRFQAVEPRVRTNFRNAAANVLA